MGKNECSLFLAQLGKIAQNQPIPEELKCYSEDMKDLQDGINYISECLLEVREFFFHLCKGELNIDPPSRQNFYAGGYKELQSALKHLTWQADQIAHGDYNQSVDFLGDFSTSFNEMIKQLKEREAQLKYQSEIMEKSVDFMKSIMNSLEEWIIVTDKNTHDIIFWNSAVEKAIGTDKLEAHICGCMFQELFDYISTFNLEQPENKILQCLKQKPSQVYQIKSWELQWDGRAVYVHYVMNITEEAKKQERMTEMAYVDPLTGLHNRRYCLDKISFFRKHKENFIFSMIDLDGLKYANDTFGHNAGDKYLITVSKIINKNIRSSDIACRIGGDEFALIFIDCTIDIVEQKLEKINKSICSVHDDFPMSISYGTIFSNWDSPLSVEEIMNQADEKMYIMKRNHKKVSNNYF